MVALEAYLKNPVILAQKLLTYHSITPDNTECLDFISQLLTLMHFDINFYNKDKVNNLWATYGNNKPIICFAGHSDVVPPGNINNWQHPPFAAKLVDNELFGRGARDMKAAIAAQICSIYNFLQKNPQPNFTIAVLFTGDEEGPAIDGTKYVLQQLQQQSITIDYCLISEPTCEKFLGDTIKIGRRGSISGNLVINGNSGHVAYPEKTNNLIHQILPILAELQAITWDKGDLNFPATTLQITDLNTNNKITNMTPHTVNCCFNLRFSPAITIDKIQSTINNLLEKYKLNFEIAWQIFAEPFLLQDKLLLENCLAACEQITGSSPQCSTSGGTSDARFLAAIGTKTIELGLLNNRIHKDNEYVTTTEITQLTNILQAFLNNMQNSL